MTHPSRVLAASVALASVAAPGCEESSQETAPPQQAPEDVVGAFFAAVGAQDVGALEALVRPDYIQHSAFAADGRQGLIDALPTLGAIKVETHRTLVDGDLVALHQTYELPDGTRMVAFDIFRVEGGQLAEHWDALQAEVPAAQSASGRSMVDGHTEVSDLEQTEANRALVSEFVREVLTKGRFDKLGDYLSTAQYDQHNPFATDGIEGLLGLAQGLAEQGVTFYFTRTPLVVAEGNFVLTASEGVFGPSDSPPYAIFYDLFRVEGGKIVEHWDVIPQGPDADALPHDNGFF